MVIRITRLIRQESTQKGLALMLALGCLSNSHIIKEISDLLKFGDNMVATILNDIK